MIFVPLGLQEVRMSVPVWTMPNSSGLVSEELPGDHYGSNGGCLKFPSPEQADFIDPVSIETGSWWSVQFV